SMVDTDDHGFVECTRNGNVRLKNGRSSEMYEHLKSRQRRACRGVNNRRSRRVPTSTEEPRTFSIERRDGMFRFDDAPGRDHYEKTPCSSRPIRVSTSRAPMSVLARSIGMAPPSPV